ncbi:lipoxygenase homology domain-containing 1-like, partial [Paramuricea clavata]
MDTFRLEGIDLGELVKLRIGHDNRGVGPGWFLDKVTVEDEGRGKVFEFPCHRWLAKDEDDRQITRELVCVNGSQQADMYITPGVPYSVHVSTGDVRNAATSANVFVVLYGGEDGQKNSGKLVLRNEKNDNFQKGRTDIFQVETADCLSPLHHITIGHDNTGLGAGWFCDKIVVDCPSTGCQQVFLCQQWIADDEGDGRLERELYESEDMRQKRRPKIVYNVWVWTSDERGAGTDANVFITLYGKKGKTDEMQIGNATDNFEQGQLDKFKVELANVGPLYKLRIRHDNSKSFADWHLEKIQVENTKTGAKFSFKCERWLSLKEDDRSIIKELPAFGEGVQPQQVFKYPVNVHTAKKTGAGTDANVFLNIFGNQGDTGERPLMFSKTNRNKFEKGNVDEFEIEAVNLKDLEKIRIGHDGKGPGAGWFLDKVVIKDPSDSLKEYNFPCERWLAKDEDDGQIIRELTLGGTSLLQTTSYKVAVRTGDVRGAGTDANVYIQIFGKQGDTGKLPLRQSENTKNKFEKGRADMFTVEAVDIGKLEMVRIGHDGKGFGAGWYLDEVTVEVPSRGEIMVFPCHRWLAEDEDDGKIERELYSSQKNNIEQKIPYEVVVHTGDVRGAGTDANVILTLYGEKGKSDEFKLRNKTDNFERAKVDKFKVESEDIGALTKIRIGHDNAGFGAAWFLDKVEISRIKPEEEGKAKKNKKKKSRSSDDDDGKANDENDYEYSFLCNRWLAKNEDDGEIVRELVPSTKSGLKRQNTLSENTYVIHVYTGDVMHAGTNANVLATVYGENGDSGERKLLKSEKHLDKFERNQEDIFTIKCITLGTLSKLKIRHDNSGMKSAWFLGKVEIEDKLKGQRYVFPCDRWLATNEDDGQISRDLPALTSEDYNAEQKRKMTRRQSSKALVDSLDLESKARLSSYEVSVVTGDISGAGTDANVYVILFGDKGESGKLDMKTSQTNKDKFERNQTDVFSLDADVGVLKKIRIGHDNKGGFAGWFLDKVEIDSKSLGTRWVFPCGRWLDKGKDDGLLERELYPVEDAEQVYTPHVPYEMTVYTGDVSGAGTNANVFIVVYGAELNTGECVLAETKKKKKGCFERGSTDQFVKELIDVGDVIEKIRVGHDGKGIGAGWFLDKVEIRRLLDDNKSATLYTFPCKRWLAKGEDDGAIVRELVPRDVTEEIVTKNGEVVANKVEHQALDVHKYRVHVITGDVKGAGTDANVFITLFGQYGDSGERPLTKSETHTDKFERGKEDIFSFEAADLGNLHKIKLRHDNAMLNPAWFVERVEIEDLTADRQFLFHCERWLAKNKEDKKIERNFYEKDYKGDRSTTMTGMSMASSLNSSPSRGDPSPSKKRSTTADEIFEKEFKDKAKKNAPLKSISYTVRVKTGDDKDGGTEAKVYIVLIGTQATTDKIDLELVQKTEFEPGTAETFSVEGVDVGEVRKVEVGHNGYSQKDGWHLKEIEIDVPTRGKVYHFPCNRWLAKDKEDGLTTRVLTASEGDQVSYKPLVPYEITVFSGDVKDAGTDSDVTFTIYGSDGATPEVKLEKGDERFERGGVDMFRMELEDVGKLRKMRIGHEGKGNRTNWYLDKVIIRNDDTGSVSVFKCNDWLSKTLGDQQLVKELPAITDGEKTLGSKCQDISKIL